MDERTIFLTALEIENATERAAYLNEACADDPALRRRIERLLGAFLESGQFLDVPALEQLAAAQGVPIGERKAFDASSQDGQKTSGDHPMSDSSSPTFEQPPHADIDDEVVRACLEPSNKPGALGRLSHYEVEEILGKGAFGIVFRAFDEKLRRVVAIKVMAPQLATSGTARKRFIREAQAAAAIRDEHVVNIHAVEEAGPLPYLVMEFISGVTLSTKIDKDGGCEVKEVLRIGMQAAKGLAAAHQQGLIHRDIKPGNILLENSVQRVKITDFGLARATDDASLTGSGVITGTPLYMSPEQARGEPLDHRSDLFSLGSVLYSLCAGRPAFRAGNTVAVLQRVCEDMPRSIREINLDIPDWLEEIIAKLMAKDRSDRFQTAAEVAELLGEHLSHLQRTGNTPRTTPVRGKTVRPRRRFPVQVAVAALLMTMGTLITWLVIQTINNTGPNVLGPSAEAKPQSSEKKPELPPVPSAPRNAAQHIAQGRLLLKQNRPKEARIEFEEALSLEPENVDAASELAKLMLQNHWRELQLVDMKSNGGAVLTLEKDGVIFVSGENPDRAIYTLKFKLGQQRISAIRIESLPDPRLPYGGAGRFPRNGKFFVAELRAATTSADNTESKPESISWAVADCEAFCQTDNCTRPVTNAIDGNPKTFWDTWPHMAQPHWAVFGFKHLVEVNNGYLIVTLDTGTPPYRWLKTGLGRFRISVTSSDEPQRLAIATREFKGFASLGAAYVLEGNTKRGLAAFAIALKQTKDANVRATIRATIDAVEKNLPWPPVNNWRG